MKTISPGSQSFLFYCSHADMSIAKYSATLVYATWSPAANVSKFKEGSRLKRLYGRLWKKVHLTSLLAFLQFLKGPWQMDSSNPNHPLPPETETEMNEALYSPTTLVTRGKGPNRNSPALPTVVTPLTALFNVQMMLWFSRWQAERFTWKKETPDP